MDPQLKTLCMVGLLALIIFLVMYAWNNREQNREGYGGPIKRIRRIPKEDCYAICGQYYNDCMAPHYQGRYIDFGDCHRRRDNCISVCNYSDFHRL